MVFLISKSKSYSNIWQNQYNHIRNIIFIPFVLFLMWLLELTNCNLSDMQSCKACRREQSETPCVSITFPFTASHKTREKLPNMRKMQMCEFLCSLLKLITQTVTRFDRTHWKHSRNVLTTSLRHSHDMPFIMQSYDYRLHLHCIVLCVYFD